MAKSNLRPSVIKDVPTSRAINELYKQVNSLLTSLSSGVKRYPSEALEGSVRAVHEGGDKYRIEGKTSNGWIGVTAQRQLKGESYINMPRITSSGVLNISNEISSNGPIKLNSAKDIELNADGGQVTIKDDTASHFLFDCDATMLRIYDDTDVADYFDITVAANGATTLQTVDGGSNAANLKIKADGGIRLMSAEDEGIITFEKEDTAYATIRTHHSMTDFTMFENGGASTVDFFSIRVSEHGATELITEDNAAFAAHFKISADGNINLDSHEIVILDGRDTATAGRQIELRRNGTRFGHFLGLDIASDFLLYERGGLSTDDFFRIRVAEHGETVINTIDTAAAAAHLTIQPDGNLILKGKDGVADSIQFTVGGTNQFASLAAEDGNWSRLRMYEMGGDSATDYFQIYLEDHGITTISTVDAGGTQGDLTITADGEVKIDAAADHHIELGKGTGFTRSTHVDAANVTVDFRDSNKAHLDMTGGSISGTLTLQFPALSGNFVLAVQQDGSTRTIAAYATKDAAGNAGNNDGGTGGAIRWQGGSVPDLTDGGNKRDILSFYWDATEEVCYGVASLNF